MDRRGHVLGELRVEPAPALLRDAELLAEERLRRGRAEADEHVRLHDRELGLEPRAAGHLLRQLGFAWMRRLPRASHLKCLTAFVT